jgi:hypothetical protein
MNELYESTGMAKAARDHYKFNRDDLGTFELRRAVIIVENEEYNDTEIKEVYRK